jgi:hypothetical protein
MLLKGPRSHTSSNTQFTSSQLVLYITKGVSLPDLAKEIEEESTLDTTSTHAALGFFGSDGMRSGGRVYPTPIRVTKCGSCIPLRDSADSQTRGLAPPTMWRISSKSAGTYATRCTFGASSSSHARGLGATRHSAYLRWIV